MIKMFKYALIDCKALIFSSYSLQSLVIFAYTSKNKYMHIVNMRVGT